MHVRCIYSTYSINQHASSRKWDFSKTLGQKKESKENQESPPGDDSGLAGFSVSKEELEQEKEEKGHEPQSSPIHVEAQEKTPAQEETPAQETPDAPAPADAEAEVLKPDAEVVELDDSQPASGEHAPRQLEFPPSWDDDCDHASKNKTGPDNIETIPMDIAEDAALWQDSQVPPELVERAAEESPVTPSKEELEALEKTEEQEHIQSDEENLKRRQAFKDWFRGNFLKKVMRVRVAYKHACTCINTYPWYILYPNLC